eukprot:scaffold1392_cov86-Skeletonema_menzelii.AAC.3
MMNLHARERSGLSGMMADFLRWRPCHIQKALDRSMHYLAHVALSAPSCFPPTWLPNDGAQWRLVGYDYVYVVD